MTMGELIPISDFDYDYFINGICYKVSSRFEGFESPKFGSTLTERFENYIGGDFAHLTTDKDENTIQAEYVCSTAGEED